MPHFFTRTKALIKKEILAIFCDKKSRMAAIIPPIIQLVIFGYAATLDVMHVPYALYDQDHSAESRAFIAQMEGSSIFQRVATVNSNQEIDKLINRKDICLAIVFPQNYARGIQTNQDSKIQVIADARNSNTAGIAMSYIQSIATQQNIELLTLAKQKDHNSMTSSPIQASIESRTWFNPNKITRNSIVPGLLATLGLINTVLLASLTIAREREEGTLDQLLVAPYTHTEILLCKGLATVLISTIQCTLILLLTLFWFHISLEGHLWVLCLGVFLFILSATAVGLAISAFSRSLQQAIVGTFLFIVPLVMLSGFATPIESMPPFFQKLTLLNPLRYAIEIVRGVFLEGSNIGAILPQLLFILALLIIASIVALLSFKWGTSKS